MATRNLTDAFLRTFKCDAGNPVTEVRDSEVTGLEVRAWASGARSWRLHYTRRSDGRRRVVGLGSYPAVPLKEARVKAKRLQAEIEDEDKRGDPAAEKQARKQADTFAEVVAEWVERHGKPNKDPRTLRDDMSMLDLHVLPSIGAMKAREIARRDVIKLLDEVAAKTDARPRTGAAGGKVGSEARKLTRRPNSVFALIRSIFRWANARDLLQTNPTAGVAPPIKKESARDRELSADEILELWNALERAPARRRAGKGLPRGTKTVSADDVPMLHSTAIMLQLALTTAQRIGEVAGMAEAELDLNDVAPVWVIPAKRTKNREPHRVPLSPLAVRLIQAARLIANAGSEDGRPRPWIFPNPTRTGPVDRHAPTRAVSRARKSGRTLGLENFRIHDLRRTAATRMAEIGIPPHTISLILNHVSARKGTVTGKVYVQYSYDREKREALEKWGARLECIINNDGAKNIVSLRA